jgi:hypothetical protein
MPNVAENFGRSKSLDDEAFGPVVLTASEVAVLRGAGSVTMMLEAGGGMGSAVERQRSLDERLKKYR